MASTGRRGRPRKIIETGATPEMLVRRAQGRLREPLDELLWRGIIDAEQHRAGLRLRHMRVVACGLVTPSSAFHWLECEEKTGNLLSDEARMHITQHYHTMCRTLRQRNMWGLVEYWCFSDQYECAHLSAPCFPAQQINQAFEELRLAINKNSTRNGHGLNH